MLSGPAATFARCASAAKEAGHYICRRADLRHRHRTNVREHDRHPTCVRLLRTDPREAIAPTVWSGQSRPLHLSQFTGTGAQSCVAAARSPAEVRPTRLTDRARRLRGACQLTELA